MIGNKKVLAVTLARGGSKKIPRKNIIDINGKPLLGYTTEVVQKSKYVDAHIVSTDDTEISIVAQLCGASVHMRDPSLALDTTTSAAALLDVAKKHPDYDYVVEVMATNPLKTTEDLDNVIKKLYDTGADSVVSVVRIWDQHPSRVKYIKDDKLMDFYPEIPESRRQDLTPAAYVRNGSIYATTMKSFLEHKVRLGPDTRPHIMSEENTINIDEPRDLELARILLK
tara:strand:+ start:205 stop:882 length:678 start_codon:yes stop_codon:yes gene_type:complete